MAPLLRLLPPFSSYCVDMSTLHCPWFFLASWNFERGHLLPKRLKSSAQSRTIMGIYVYMFRETTELNDDLTTFRAAGVETGSTNTNASILNRQERTTDMDMGRCSLVRWSMAGFFFSLPPSPSLYRSSLTYANCSPSCPSSPPMSILTHPKTRLFVYTVYDITRARELSKGACGGAVVRMF